MKFTEFRLKFKRFLRKNGKIILIVFIIWAIIFGINLILKFTPEKKAPISNYEPHVSVMNSNSKVSDLISKNIEEMIEKYMTYCNDGNYQAAFNMLTEDCKEHELNKNVENFMEHVLMRMPTPKKYGIQNYSNISIDGMKAYIYSIKYYDDYLATGLTNSDYKYTTEKLTFYRDGNELKMAAGNYIYHEDIKQITENEYLKIDVIEKTVNYSIETYTVKFTNRSDYTVVLADNFEENEIQLKLKQELRERADKSINIVLGRQMVERSIRRIPLRSTQKPLVRRRLTRLKSMI